MSHTFFSTVDIIMSSLYRGAKDGEIIGIIGENKHLNGLEINLVCVIIIFNHRFSVFNVCYSLRSIFMHSASRRHSTSRQCSASHRALISTSGRDKR